MKKLILLCLSLVLCFTMVGCSSKTDEPVADAGEETAKGKIVFIATQLGDLSFNDNGWEGVQAVGEKYGYETNVVESGMDSSKYENMFLELCDQDYDYIVAQNGNGWGDVVLKYAADYPEKKFIIFDCSTKAEVTNENVVCIAFKANEGSYLAGYVAAAMSKTGKIAAGANRNNPGPNDFMAGFITGAVDCNPDIKISIAYNSVPGDAAAMGDIATALFNQDVDVMFSVAGSAGLGIFQAAQTAGALAIGCDSDQYLTYSNSETPELASVIMTSMMKKIGDSLITTFDRIEDGSIEWGTLEVLGIAEGAVGLAVNDNFNALIPAELQTEVEDLIAKISAGEITIPSYFDYADDADFRALVDSVAF